MDALKVAESQNQRSVGISILALLTAQVGLLALLFSGSVFLKTSVNATVSEWDSAEMLMLLIGIAYLVLAYGLWTLQRWTRLYAIVTLAAVLVAGILNTMDNKLMDLGAVLVFSICWSVNIVVIVWFQLPGIRGKFS